MVALFALLDHFNQTPLRPWIWGITLNGVISAIRATGLIIILSMASIPWCSNSISTRLSRQKQLLMRRRLPDGARYTLGEESQGSRKSRYPSRYSYEPKSSQVKQPLRAGREDHYLAMVVQGAMLLNRYIEEYHATRGIYCPTMTGK